MQLHCHATHPHIVPASCSLTKLVCVCVCVQIYAQNAIRKKNEALNYMRLGSRLDAVVSRLDTQAKMQVGGSFILLMQD